MASSTENVQLGVCRAYFKGVDLGLTKGGVEVQVTTETYTVEVDQYGKTPIKELIQGRAATCSVPMAESTIQNMAALMPGSKMITDGRQAQATISASAIPAVDDTITIYGTVFTFKASPANAHQIRIGLTLADTLKNAAGVITRSGVVANLGGLTCVTVGTPAVGLLLTAVDYGTRFNTVTIAVTGAALTVGGAHFANGVEVSRARLDVSSGAGLDLLNFSGELRLHPIGRADTDFSDDFTFYRAAAPGELQFAYKTDAERIFQANFKGYPMDDGRIFAVGDPQAVSA